MTNHRWAFSIDALQRLLGLESLVVVNDFTALAMALPLLQPSEMRQVGGGAAIAGAAMGLIGPGTGLGVSGLIPLGRKDGAEAWIALQGEGGHATLAGRTAREKAVLAELEQQYGHAAAERAVSGQGLVDIRKAVATLDASHQCLPVLTGAEITRRAHCGDVPCAEALNLFCAFLGTAAGNLALTLGARGGVYIGGGIAPQIGDWLEQSPFRQRFESKGRFSAYLSSIPVFLINAGQSPALLGAARVFDSQRYGL